MCDCPTRHILPFRQRSLRQRFENCQLSNVTLPITFITGPNGQMASRWPLPPSTCFSFTFYATIWMLFFPCSVTFMYPAAPTKKLNFPLNPVSLSFLIPLRNLQKYSYFRILSHKIEKHGNTSVCWTGTIPCLSRSRSLPEIFRSIPTSEYYLLRLISCFLTKPWQQHLSLLKELKGSYFTLNPTTK